LLLTVLAALVPWISAMPQGFVVLPVIAFGLCAHHLHRAPRGLLRFREDGEVLWIDGDSREHALTLLGVGSRGPLRVLRFQAGQRRFSAMYCRPGNLDPAQGRRLTLWLRRSGNRVAQAGDPAVTP